MPGLSFMRLTWCMWLPRPAYLHMYLLAYWASSSPLSVDMRHSVQLERLSPVEAFPNMPNLWAVKDINGEARSNSSEYQLF